ncbi:MAG: hypothetical protein ABEJ56_06935 [Candidatus Nanohaloarchaea archaeon]
MRSFESLKDQGRIEQVSRDKARARGLLKRSEKRLENQKKREITESNAFEVLENTYECLREVVEADMALKGFSSEDHVGTIAYAKEKLDLDESEVNRLHKFRKLRNESRYEAKDVEIREAEDIMEFAEKLLPEIKSKVEKEL